MNRENHRLEKELEQARNELKEVEGFIKDWKNMSANLVDMTNRNKQLQQDLKQMDSVVKTLKSEKGENFNPNVQITQT